MADRRELHFTSFDQVLDEARQLAEAEKAGKLKTSGTWTLGQSLGHMAGWATSIHDGTHPHVPFMIRMSMAFMKNSMLNSPMKAGVKLPGIAGGTLFTDVLPPEEGLSRMFRAAEVVKAMPEPIDHPLLGNLTRQQFTALILRHSELHLSYFQVQ